jgi:ParB family chromosome partitioning protein
MTKKSRTGLGSGLDDMTRGIEKLYEGQTVIFNPEDENKEPIGHPLLISIDKITQNPDQPRKYFNTIELTKLSDSIKAKGIIEPLVVRINKDNNNYQLVVGHRRLLAAKQAGLKEVPVIISDMPDDPKERLEVALMENIIRENLNPIEEAEGFYRLEKEIGQNVLAIAKLFGKDRSTIVNSIRLLDLPEEIKENIKTGQLSAGHGRAILSVKNPNDMLEVRNIILNKTLTVRETELLVKRYNKKLSQPQQNNDSNNDDLNKDNISNDYYNSLCSQISNKLGGLNVNINNTTKIKKIEIYYNNNEDIEKIMNILGIIV